MRYCDWDEVLDRDGLLILTEEALTPPRRSRAPMRRLAAAAACAGLVLGLMNYRAVAAGVGELCRYFAGIGATADDKAELWVLEEPVTWTEGDWTYEADATLRSGVLELELTMSSRLPADQLPSPVELRLDEAAAAVIDGAPAGERDFDTEFLDYILAVRVVDGVEGAVAHIAAHSTGHSECIVTGDERAAHAFQRQVDSAAVYWNASTRFTDGGEFGLGCEMGISTQKLYARGPLGLAELCTFKFIIRGNGQIR